MKAPTRLGDALEHGGQITTASSTLMMMGKPVARQGDEALCAQHGRTYIAEGHSGFSDRDGAPVAMHLHRCNCGCRLLASLTHVKVA